MALQAEHDGPATLDDVRRAANEELGCRLGTTITVNTLPRLCYAM